MINKNQKEERTPEEECFSSAMNILRQSDHSYKMLYEKLLKKGYDKDTVIAVIERIKKTGIINEERLFKRHAEYLAQKKFFGEMKIKAELSRLFSKSTFDLYIEDALSDIDFKEYALILSRKNKNKGRDFVIRKLSRCGYSSSVIRYAIGNTDFQEREGQNEQLLRGKE